MDLGLTGKHALITGGSRGIGLSIAHTLIEEGCRVSVVSRNGLGQELTGGESSAIESFAFDLASGDAEQLRQQVEARIGTVDIVVANAARTSRPKKLTHMPEEDWHQTLETDLNGHYRLLRAFLPGLQERGWGRIIFIGSLSGMVGVSAYPAYCTVKAGYEGLMKNLAVDYSKYGLTVNLISPGFVATERFKQAAPEEMIEKFKRATASRRLAEPEDVAHAVAFLASAQASYITGVNLPVCGGLNLGNLW